MHVLATLGKYMWRIVDEAQVNNLDGISVVGGSERVMLNM